MRIATWNVNSIRARMEQLERWVGTASPDVLCLQETKVTDTDFPSAQLKALGFVHQAVWGQKTYNGVAILSRHPVHAVVRGFVHGDPDPQARLLRATIDGVRIVNCYVPNGSTVGSEKFRYKIAWLARLRDELADETAPDRDLLMCGDLNIAPDDSDVWDPFACDGRLLFHPTERDTLQRLVTAAGLTDAYRALHPTGGAFSWWDYRGGAFRKNQGFRIDHLFASPSLLARTDDVTTWPETRTWTKPSDHVPVGLDVRPTR